MKIAIGKLVKNFTGSMNFIALTDKTKFTSTLPIHARHTIGYSKQFRKGMPVIFIVSKDIQGVAQATDMRSLSVPVYNKLSATKDYNDIADYWDIVVSQETRGKNSFD